MLTWGLLRLPETLHPEYRRSLAPREILRATVETVREPLSRGYTLALTVTFGALIAYISTIQQIVFDVFKAPGAIGLVFGAVAAPMALASWTNARFVGRFGLRRVGHGGALAFAVVTLIHALIATAGYESLTAFIIFQALAMVCFSFCSSNLGTLAMERMGPIAGTASSVQGVVGTIGGSAVGYMIGQAYDGSARPLALALLTAGIGCLLLVLYSERGKLFRRLHGQVAQA